MFGQFVWVFSWAYHLFQIICIVLNDLRGIIQNRVQKGVVQFFVDAVYQDGHEVSGPLHPAGVPAVEQALQQAVLLRSQRRVRLRGFLLRRNLRLSACRWGGFRRNIRLLIDDELLPGNGGVPADARQPGIVDDNFFSSAACFSVRRR